MMKNPAITNWGVFISKTKTHKRSSFLPDSYVPQRRLSRKDLQNDILDTHVQCFDQPSVPHRPRLLLYNMEKSYLSKRPDLYKGPRRKITPNVTSRNSSRVARPPIKRNSHSPRNSPINLPRRHAKVKKTSATVQRSKDFILSNKEKVDFLSWSFMKDLTSNLVNASVLSDTFAVQLCDKVIQKWTANLPQSRLFMLTGNILLETGVGIDGLLSKFDPQLIDRITHTDEDVDNDEYEIEVHPSRNDVAETSNDSEIKENFDENESHCHDDQTDDQVDNDDFSSQHPTLRESNLKIVESRQKERKRWSTSIEKEQLLKGKVHEDFSEDIREESVKEDISDQENQEEEYAVGSTSSSYKSHSSEKAKRVALATVKKMLDDLILDDKI